MVWLSLASSFFFFLQMLFSELPVVQAIRYRSSIGNQKFKDLQENVDIKMKSRPQFNFAQHQFSALSTYGTSTTSYFLEKGFKMSETPYFDRWFKYDEEDDYMCTNWITITSSF